MQRTTLTWIAPPVAVWHYGAASATAFPIAVFWVTALFSLGYGLAGGMQGLTRASALEIVVGIMLWNLATVWARLVIRGVANDEAGDTGSPHQQKVDPRADEADPLDIARNGGTSR